MPPYPNDATASDDAAAMTRQSQASETTSWRLAGPCSSDRSISAPRTIITETIVNSVQSVVQPKWNTQRPTAGATAMALLLAKPQYAIPCVRRDSGMYSLISADAEAMSPDQTAP